MGKLTDFVSKGVRLIVVDPNSAAGGEAPDAETPAPRSPHPREIR
jgi:hypothetical protein